MPPKKDQDAATAESLRILCVLLETAKEFDPDFDAVAEEIGMAQARNVPRKVNTIIEPLGFTLLRRKVVKLGDNGAPATPAVTAKETTPAKTKAQAIRKKTADQGAKEEKSASMTNANNLKHEANSSDEDIMDHDDEEEEHDGEEESEGDSEEDDEDEDEDEDESEGAV